MDYKEKLKEIIAKTSKVKTITPETNLKDLGLDSLDLAEVLMEIEEELNIYDEEDFFFRTPRFKRNVISEKFHIDSPPENQILNQRHFS